MAPSDAGHDYSKVRSNRSSLPFTVDCTVPDHVLMPTNSASHGVQDVLTNDNGSHTGEISTKMLKQARRHLSLVTRSVASTQ